MSEPVRSTPPPPPSGAASDVVRVQQLASARDEIVARLKQRIVGQDEVIELLLIALFARGQYAPKGNDRRCASDRQLLFLRLMPRGAGRPASRLRYSCSPNLADTISS